MEGRLVLDHCATLPTKTLSGKRIYLKGSGKGYFREILPVDAVFVMNSKIYLRKISQDNHLLLLSLLLLRPPFPWNVCFVDSSERDIHYTTSPTSLRQWICPVVCQKTLSRQCFT